MSEALPAQPKKVRMRKPTPKALLTKDPEPPPVVVDHTFFAALGGPLKSLQRDNRQAKLASLRIAETKWLTREKANANAASAPC